MALILQAYAALNLTLDVTPVEISTRAIYEAVDGSVSASASQDRGSRQGSADPEGRYGPGKALHHP